MALIPGMLRDANDKTAITSIINSAKPKEVEGVEKDANPGLDAAVDDMWSAFESKDKSAFREALKSFIEMCDAPEAEAPSESEAE